MSMTRSLSIRLLGRLEIRAGTVPVRIGGRHAQALIGLLALRPRLRLRDTIAAELWPDAGGPSAASLRQALWLVRSSFAAAGLSADDWLETDQDSLGLRRDIQLDLDTDLFERLAQVGGVEPREVQFRHPRPQAPDVRFLLIAIRVPPRLRCGETCRSTIWVRTKRWP